MARPRKSAVTANEDSNTDGAARAKPKRARKSAPRERECRRPSSAQRSSAYRGVTRHRWTGRFEAHLWDKDTWNHESPAKKKKGKQVYLGAYDDEEAAARAHDLAALKYWGAGTVLNFPLCSYDEELKEMEGQSREEYVGSVRRKSSGFSRGVSKYRGVARHHHNGRWEARVGRVLSNKYLYLGTYATQEEAAVAYDVAAIEHRGLNAVTNFDISHYVNWHRRRRGIGKEGLDASEMIPVHPPNDLTEHARARANTIGLDETVAVATAFRDGEHQPQHPMYHVADSYIAQLPGDEVRTPVAPTTPSALDLLLRSPNKFTEMMEQLVSSAETTTTTTTKSNASSTSAPCTPSSSPSPELISGGASSASAPPCTFFPDDVQTRFEFGCDDDDEGGMSFAFAEVDTFLFGDLGSYAAPMFQCDADVFVQVPYIA